MNWGVLGAPMWLSMLLLYTVVREKCQKKPKLKNNRLFVIFCHWWHFNWVGRARALLYAKMLRETESDETRRFCHLFLIGDISIGGGCGAGPRPLPPGFAYSALLVMIARSWLFCYDMLGYTITKTYLFFFHEIQLAVSYWAGMWKRKRLIFCGSGSTLAKETGSELGSD